jgi:hypothetical protein
MILCRYFDEYGINLLRRLKLKVNIPSSFNDPFENSAYIEGKEIKYEDIEQYLRSPATLDRWYQKYRNKFGGRNRREFEQNVQSKNWNEVYNKIKTTLPEGLKETLENFSDEFNRICRVLCFSDLSTIKPHEEILMWSHYANKHTGLRVSFDINKFNFKSKGPDKILYQDNRIGLPINKIASLHPDIFEEFSRALVVKSNAWAYECEYRWFIHIKECLSEKIGEKKLDFVAITPESIQRVDIGVRSSPQFKQEVINLLKHKQFLHVDLRIATIDEKKFKLNYEKGS